MDLYYTIQNLWLLELREYKLEICYSACVFLMNNLFSNGIYVNKSLNMKKRVVPAILCYILF